MILHTIIILSGLLSGECDNLHSFLNNKVDQFSINVWNKLSKKSYCVEFLQYSSREEINKDPAILRYTGDYIYHFHNIEKYMEYGFSIKCAAYKSETQMIYVPMWDSLKIRKDPVEINDVPNRIIFWNKKLGDKWYGNSK